MKSLLIVLAMGAIGGAVNWGFAQSHEVRGDTEIPAELHAVPEAGAVPSAQDLGAYLAGLRAEDYTTYTHPTLDYAFRYPKEFVLGTAVWGDEDVTDVHHPRYRLSFRVTVRPIAGNEEMLAYLTMLPEDYDWVAPAGAGSTAVRWLDEGVPSPGRWRGNVWFVHRGRLVEILMAGPDRDLVESWLGKFVHTDLTLIRAR